MVYPRVGIGTDVHAFAEADSGREMWLGGVLFEGEIGLVGHSDADVAAHALCDAIFSACSLGDLGSNFGTDDPQFAGASGTRLLTETAHRARAAGFRVLNASVQVIGNRPKLSPRRAEMTAALSEAAGAPISITGTTSDGLGLTGRGEGVAAVATALVIEEQSPDAR